MQGSFSSVTVIDQRDASPITGALSSTVSLSQVIKKDADNNDTWTPNYASPNNVITAQVFHRGVEATALLVNGSHQWRLGSPTGTLLVNDDDYIVGTTTLTLKTNKTTPRTIFFVAKHKDAVTKLETTVALPFTVDVIPGGDQAKFIDIKGKFVIKKSPTATQGDTAVYADVVRNGAIDNTNVKYKWWLFNGSAFVQLNNTHPQVTNDNINFVPPANIVNGVIGLNGSEPTSSAADALLKGIRIKEGAVSSAAILKVEAFESDGTTLIADAQFDIIDQSDPYTNELVLSGGNAFLNGDEGATPDKAISVNLYYGGGLVVNPDTTKHKFTLSILDNAGKRAGFTSSEKADGWPISAITGTVNAANQSITVSGTNIPVLSTGRAAKIVAPNGLVRTVELESTATAGLTVQCKVPTAGTGFANLAVDTIVQSEFANGRLYLLENNGGDIQKAGLRYQKAYNALGTLTKYDIDGMGAVTCLHEYF